MLEGTSGKYDPGWSALSVPSVEALRTRGRWSICESLLTGDVQGLKPHQSCYLGRRRVGLAPEPSLRPQVLGRNTLDFFVMWMDTWCQ